MNNFQYEAEGIRAWRAFEIGDGDLLPYTSTSGSEEPTGLTLVSDFGNQECGKMAKKGQASSSSKSMELLFPCTEPGCIKSYESEEMLEQHLDTGKHTMHVEQESAYDRIKKNWAKTLSGLTVGMQKLSVAESSMKGLGKKDESTELKSGWALKSPKKPTRMTENVKSFLVHVFNEGQRTGRKANPHEVAHTMKYKLNESGKLTFHPDEWRNAKQIASFFSRMASVRKGQEANADDCEALVQEQEWQEMRETVYQQLDYGHPLVYEDMDLCNLAEKNGIGKLKLKCLKDICEHFNISVTGSKTRKDSYVMPLLDFVLSCRCT